MPLSTQIKIAAPLAVVREKILPIIYFHPVEYSYQHQQFLQFDKIPTYHTYGHFGVHTSTASNRTFNQGDLMKVAVNGMELTAVVIENSPQAFIWANLKNFFLNSILLGQHSFHFQPSEITNRWTTFVQAERITGVLSFLFGESWLAGLIGIRAKAARGFEAYNRDLKAWCEEGSERM